MPGRSSAEEPDLLVDTSVAVPLVVADHVHHNTVFRAVGSRRLGLCGHAAFETFSVLTRLPVPARRSPAAVARILASNFPHSRFLGSRASAALLSELDERSVAGGAVYDALVAAAAAEHGLVLATRDERAVPTYRAFGMGIELVG